MSIFDLLVVAMVAAAAARAIRRIRRGMGGPIEDVPDAPPDAKPLATVRYDDNGLATYSFSWLPPAVGEEGEPEPDRSSSSGSVGSTLRGPRTTEG